MKGVYTKITRFENIDYEWTCRPRTSSGEELPTTLPKHYKIIQTKPMNNITHHLIHVVIERWQEMGWRCSNTHPRHGTTHVYVELNMVLDSKECVVVFELCYAKRRQRWHDPSVFVSKLQIHDFIYEHLVSHPDDREKTMHSRMKRCWQLVSASAKVNKAAEVHLGIASSQGI